MVVSVCSMKKSGKSPADISFSNSPVKFSGWCSVIMQRVTDIFFIHLRTFVPSYELRVKLLTCMPFRDVALQAKRGCLFSKRSEFRNFEMPIRISAISPKSSGIGTLFFPILPAATHVASWWARGRRQIARIDVQLRQDAAETMVRRSGFPECNKKKKNARKSTVYSHFLSYFRN